MEPDEEAGPVSSMGRIVLGHHIRVGGRILCEGPGVDLRKTYWVTWASWVDVPERWACTRCQVLAAIVLANKLRPPEVLADPCALSIKVAGLYFREVVEFRRSLNRLLASLEG